MELYYESNKTISVSMVAHHHNKSASSRAEMQATCLSSRRRPRTASARDDAANLEQVSSLVATETRMRPSYVK